MPQASLTQITAGIIVFSYAETRTDTDRLTDITAINSQQPPTTTGSPSQFPTSFISHTARHSFPTGLCSPPLSPRYRQSRGEWGGGSPKHPDMSHRCSFVIP